MRAKEHKYVGLWMDERGTYQINTEKNKERVPVMIATVAAVGNKQMGTMAVQTRLMLVNVVVMKSLLHNVEVIPKLSAGEIKELEKMQHHVLTKLMNIPRSTPYSGLLLETGMWTMEARVEYRKLMLYHNIKNSEDERVIKQIVKVQEQEVRESTWLADVVRIKKKYGIEKDVQECLKSAWKKDVKQKIQERVEEEIQEKCNNMKKTRTIKDDPLKMKQYLQDMTLSEASDILRMRLHMTKLPCNYGKDANQCPLCGHQGKVDTKHYFGECQMTRRIADIWETRSEDLNGSVEKLRNAKNHLKKVEIMVEQYMHNDKKM